MSPNLEVREKLQPLARAIKDQLPPGWGLALFVFPFDDREGTLQYVSTAGREDMLKAILAWLKRNGASVENFGKHEGEIE